MPRDYVVQEIPQPTAALEDVVLTPRLELGGQVSSEKLTGIISLGRPQYIPIRPREIKDEELRQFIEHEARTSRFVLIQIVASFHPTPQLIEKVVVGLSLSNVDGNSKPPPIAWSLWPTKMTSTSSSTGKIGFKADLRILSYEATQESQSSLDRPFLVAVGERESDPEWQFTGSKQRPLVGIYPMSAVIQAPISGRARAGLLLAATLRGRLGFVRYRADLAHDYSHLEF
ncbi:hypothetical protein ACWC8S_14380 [Streptomyces fungicidicus]